MITVAKIRILRLKHEISLAELANRAGISPQRLCQLELDGNHVSVRQEERMNKVMRELIRERRAGIEELEQDYQACKGRLFELTEVPHE